MTNKERYQRAFSVLHASDEPVKEVTHMNETKIRRLPRALAACAVVILAVALATAAYAADVGGVRRTVQLWIHGDQTSAVLDVSADGSYTLTYEDAEGNPREIAGGGIAYDISGERPLTEEEIMEQLDMPDVEYRDDGTVWVYWRSQALEITDLFDESGICYVQLRDGGEVQYMTIKYQNGFSTAPDKFPNPKLFN